MRHSPDTENSFEQESQERVAVLSPGVPWIASLQCRKVGSFVGFHGFIVARLEKIASSDKAVNC